MSEEKHYHRMTIGKGSSTAVYKVEWICDEGSGKVTAFEVSRYSKLGEMITKVAAISASIAVSADQNPEFKKIVEDEADKAKSVNLAAKGRLN